MTEQSGAGSPSGAGAPSGAGSTVTVALIGNPNTGKSTLFSALVGVRQRTGNYPGVTVEKKEGRTTIGGRNFVIVDLPGTYSLAPRSPDEMVAVDVLLGRQRDAAAPDMVLCIVDATNLERNLYLVSQVLELGRPTAVAVNMVDVAESRNIQLDLARLEAQLGVPVVPVQAHRKVGMDSLCQTLAGLVGCVRPQPVSPFPDPFIAEVATLERLEQEEGQPVLPRYLLERLLLDTTGYLEQAQLPGVTPRVLAEVKAGRERLAKQGLPAPGVEAMSRYAWVGRVLDGVVRRPDQRIATWSDKVDRVVTHRVGGVIIFALLMLLMFLAVFWAAEPASSVIDAGKSLAAGWVESLLDEGPLRSLLVNGVIEGVGGVLVFLPQIFTLFFFIAVLEDCGYMARAAYLMDRLMSRIGLSGKSFIPMLSSFACAIPGIMATRVIENRRDRIATMLVAPLMSCSARLPVYTLMVSVFLPGQVLLQGFTIFTMYMLGIVLAVVMALVFKRTLLHGATPPFVMELPSYKFPGVVIVLHRMLEQGWAFVQRAGTLILAVSVLVWAAAYYPRNLEQKAPEVVQRAAAAQEAVAALERDVAATPEGDATRAELDLRLTEARAQWQQADDDLQGAYLRYSYLGQAGHWIEPIVRPLGWDWRIGCAAIASFPAREVVVATLGVIYNLGADEDESSEALAETLRDATWEGTDRKVITGPVALSIMVFFALCAQCVSTLAVMRRETNSWRWPAFTFVYMTGLAYVAALLVYQVGSWIAG